MPRKSTPTASPGSPSSRVLWNISTPVTTVWCVSLMPTISIWSPTWTMPFSTRPVTTVPRPLMPNTSSTGMRNGWSRGRSGTGMYSSTASISSQMPLPHSESREVSSASSALRALTRTMGMSSPGNPYSVRSSRSSSSTSSRSSSSSIASTLFRATTIAGTSTWRARRMCSRVWGMGPSGALTTRMAPSIWAAPVIMFLM